MTLSTRLWKLPKLTSKKQNIYNILLNRDIHFTCILCLLNNTCVKHNFKSVHVSNLFWSREYNSAKEICKYASFSKVGGNYPLDLKIIWSSDMTAMPFLEICKVFTFYDFRKKTMFDSSLPPVVCMRVHVLFTLVVFACV
jgi:hypothetical protein